MSMKDKILGALFRSVKGIPAVRRKIEKDYSKIFSELRNSVHPYDHDVPVFRGLPEDPLPREEVLNLMRDLKNREEPRWKEGFVSGAVYHGGEEHIDFLNQVYALHSQTNPLHSDLWPSIVKFESEIVSMTASILGGLSKGSEEVCGTVSSGGSESILLAMKAYRDQAAKERGVSRPEMIVPVSAHAAFDKAAQYFGIKKIEIPLNSRFELDVEAAKRAVGKNTIVMVGSAPGFPHGLIDPIEELSEFARSRGVGFHTDACLGGFVLPWARRLGYPVPAFDFTLPGVTSISADTHKYGYAAKGSSVVLYRNAKLRRYQYFTMTDWPGGVYFSPGFAGSRPGALSAICWAAMVSIGEKGYLSAVRAILEAASLIKEGIREISELEILGDPLWVIAFRSRIKEIDIYQVMDRMTQRRWNLNGLHRPPCVHLCVTLRHAQTGVAKRFLSDLKEAVLEARGNPKSKVGMAPVYGMASSFPDREMIDEFLSRYIDLLYDLKKPPK